MSEIKKSEMPDDVNNGNVSHDETLRERMEQLTAIAGPVKLRKNKKCDWKPCKARAISKHSYVMKYFCSRKCKYKYIKNWEKICPELKETNPWDECIGMICRW